MGRYGTREDELDDLLRRERLRRPLQGRRKGGLRVSRPGYGLKEMEAFLPLRARAPRSRTAAPRSSSSSTGCRRATSAARRRSTRTTARTASRRAAARLAARAARRGAGAVRAVPARRSRASRSRSAREGARARAARGAARRGDRPGARGAAPRLPRPRAQAGLVGVLRPARDDAGGARRGRRIDRPARARRRAASRYEAVEGLHVHVPAQEHKIGQGQDAVDPATGRRRARSSSSTATRAGSC